MSASAPAFTETVVDQEQRSAPARIIALGAGQRLANLDLTLWKMPSISGTIIDDFGEAVAGATVSAIRVDAPLGLPGQSFAATTDDKGKYLFPALVLGEYVIGVISRTISAPAEIARPDRGETSSDASSARRGASPGMFMKVGDLWQVAGFVTQGNPPAVLRSGRYLVRPHAFYPAAATPAAAQRLDLGPNDSRLSIDISLGAEPAAGVSGRVTFDGVGVSGVGLRLTRVDIDESISNVALDAARTTSGKDGRFAFLGVALGQYHLSALQVVALSGQVANAQSNGRWSHQLVTVGSRGASGLTVALQPGVYVRGKVAVLGGDTIPVANANMSVSLSSVGPQHAADAISVGRVNIADSVTHVRPDGQFAVGPIIPGKYSVDLTPPRGWSVVGVAASRSDALAHPITVPEQGIDDLSITITNHPSRIALSIRRSAGPRQSPLSVILFPEDQRVWEDAATDVRRFRRASPSENGSCTFESVPPGRYLILAVSDDALPFVWRRLSVLRTLAPRSTSLSIDRGELKSLSIEAK